MADRTITLGELFTDAEIERAKALYLRCAPGTFARTAAEEVVTSAIPRINRVTGQENDAKYWAYQLEFAFMRSGLQPGSEPSGAAPGAR